MDIAYGVLGSRTEAEQCLRALLISGFKLQDISLLTLHHIKAADLDRHEYRKQYGDNAYSKLYNGQDAIETLLDSNIYVMPGIGLLLAAGRFASILANLRADVAVAGIAGVLLDIGVPSADALYYEICLRDCGIMVAIDCRMRQAAVAAYDLLAGHHAEPVASTSTVAAVDHLKNLTDSA